MIIQFSLDLSGDNISNAKTVSDVLGASIGDMLATIAKDNEAIGSKDSM